MKDINLLESVQNGVWNVTLALKQAIKTEAGEFICSSSTGNNHRTVTQCHMVSAQIFNSKSLPSPLQHMLLTGQAGSGVLQQELTNLSKSRDWRASTRSQGTPDQNPHSRNIFLWRVPEVNNDMSTCYCIFYIIIILHTVKLGFSSSSHLTSIPFSGKCYPIIFANPSC